MNAKILPLKPEAKVIKPNPKYDNLSLSVLDLQSDVKKSVASKVAAAKKELPQPVQNQQLMLKFNTSSDSGFIKLTTPNLDAQKLDAAQELETALFEKAMIEDVMQRYQATQNVDADMAVDDVDLAQAQLQTYIVGILEAEAKQNGRILLPAAAAALAANMVQQLNVAELPIILAELQSQNQAKIDGLIEQALNPALAAAASGPTGPTGLEPPAGADSLDEDALLKTANDDLTPEQEQEKLSLSENITMKLKVESGSLDGRKLLTRFKNNKTDIASDTASVVKQQAVKEIGKNAAQDITNRLDSTTQQKFDQVKQIIDQMVRFESNGTTLTSAQQIEANLHSNKLATEVVKSTPKPLSTLTAA